MELEEAVTLARLQKRAFQTALEKGWHDQERPLGEALMLVTTEVAEAFEAYRDPHHDPFETWYRDGKPEGVGPEVADVVIRCLDLAEEYGIDLEAEVIRKMIFNETRLARHGGKRA